MPLSSTLAFAAAKVSISDLVTLAGAGGAIFATLGLVLVLPLYLDQRREVKRLLLWQQLEPECGDQGLPQGPPSVGAPATTATVAADPATAVTAYRPPTGELSPAQRVTAERPALARITAEREAITAPSFWRRLIARGPRHPLLLSGLALTLAVAAIAAVAVFSPGTGSEGSTENGLDRSEVAVAVLNGSSQTALAGKLADLLMSSRFEQIQTGTTGTSNQTVVFFNPGQRREATTVARILGVGVIQPIDKTARAAAPDADVVVIGGEDQVRN